MCCMEEACLPVGSDVLGGLDALSQSGMSGCFLIRISTRRPLAKTKPVGFPLWT